MTVPVHVIVFGQLLSLFIIIFLKLKPNSQCWGFHRESRCHLISLCFFCCKHVTVSSTAVPGWGAWHSAEQHQLPWQQTWEPTWPPEGNCSSTLCMLVWATSQHPLLPSCLWGNSISEKGPLSDLLMNNTQVYSPLHYFRCILDTCGTCTGAYPHGKFRSALRRSFEISWRIQRIYSHNSCSVVL